VKRGADGTIDIAIDIQAKDLQFAHSAERTAADLDVVVVQDVSSGRVRYEKQRAILDLPPAPMTDRLSVRHTLRIRLQPATSKVTVFVRDRYTGRYGTLEMPLSRIQPGATSEETERP
jgi:hypothetical protein